MANSKQTKRIVLVSTDKAFALPSSSVMRRTALAELNDAFAVVVKDHTAWL